MSLSSFPHPSLDELATFAEGLLPAARRDRVGAHLRGCARCQESLRFVRRVEDAADALPAPALPPALLERVLATRAEGGRRILPAAPGRAPARRWRRGAAWAAAAAVLVAAVALLGRTPELEAVAPDSALTLTPARPKAGETIRVRYRPTPGFFRGADSLVLRARLRTARDDMYAEAVPAHQTRAVSTLRRASGDAYEGTFVLPDSMVYASLAVEDARASRIDDNGARLWEVQLHAPDGRPLFEALDQRVSDMMGRSWEEGYGTAKRMAELYPGRIGSWTLREFFERALYGEAAADSISAAYRARVDSLVRAAKHDASLSYADLGTIFFRTWAGARNAKGVVAAGDSAELAYWWTRMRERHPRHGQVAQRTANDIANALRGRPQAQLDSIEAVYPRLAPLAGPGRNLINVALYAAREAKDDAAFRRWTERSHAGTRDSVRRVALALAPRPAFRAEAMATLRTLLGAPAERITFERTLTETAADYERRAERMRRRMLAALGRGLLAEGRTRAALDTLALAARGVWDPALFGDVASAYLTAGDTTAALAVRAKLAVDPRTGASTADSIVRSGRARLGAAAWDSATAAARSEMHARLLERSTPRAHRAETRLADGAGRAYTLEQLAKGQPSVVMFWSRHCGGAIEALPQIADVVGRLRASGVPVVFIVDEAPSADLRRYLAEKKVTWPVYHDVSGVTTDAFSNFGTPAYYVLDRAGRIRFDEVDGEPELVAMIDALRTEAR